ncbi:MAG: zinc metalloprotease HtpX [Candidatus Saccharibacteria bacterium]|nr:zinc metalloprotease HtpX [Candidatus Saccharibacteria bacterium]
MYKQIAANKRNTVFLIIGFVVLIALIGCGFAYAFDNWSISFYVLAVASIYALVQYFAATSLAVAMTGAKEVNKKDAPRLYKAVENLSITAGLPMPKVYIIDDPAPNAFATGRDPEHAVVAATTGLIDIMDDNELTAVMAHEMSHVKNYDIRVSMIVFGLVCLIGFVSDLGLRMLWYGDRRGKNDEDRSPVGFIIILITSILAPIAASLAQLAVSREREYLADISAVKLTRYPEGMISALKKLDEHGRPMKRQNSATSSMYINNPMKKGTLTKLFSTHPPIEDRIERLENAKTNF